VLLYARYRRTLVLPLRLLEYRWKSGMMIDRGVRRGGKLLVTLEGPEIGSNAMALSRKIRLIPG
jgi:hypothetical protein